MTTRRAFLSRAVAGAAVATGALFGVVGLPKRVEAKELDLGRTVEDTAEFQFVISQNLEAKYPGMLFRFNVYLRDSSPSHTTKYYPDERGEITKAHITYRYHVPKNMREEMKVALTNDIMRCLSASMAGTAPDAHVVMTELQPLLYRGIAPEEIAANLRNLSARWVF